MRLKPQGDQYKDWMASEFVGFQQAVEAPEVEAPVVEATKIEASAVGATAVEAREVEVPAVEVPKVEAPAVNTAHSVETDILLQDASKCVPEEPHNSRTGVTHVLILAATLFGCTLLVLAAVSYLSFVWYGGPNGHVWKSIIMSNWVATSVAICGIVIRWTTSLQMSVCTSLLASDFLRTGVPVSRAPRLSALRHNNSGPLDLFYVLMDWSRDAFHLHGFLLVTVAVLLTLLLQLSSTLLVSDLATAPYETFNNFTSGRVLTDISQADLSDHYYSDALMTTAPSYPLFAEYSSGHNAIDGVDDTGPVIRALLPVSADDGRADILSFAGNATIFDARWICTRPRITGATMEGGEGGVWLSGSASHSKMIPPMVTGNESAPFNCTLPVTKDGSWAWTAVTCPTNSVNAAIGLVSGIDTVYNASTLHPMLNMTQLIGDPKGSYESRPWSLPYAAAADMTLGYFDWPVGLSFLLINMTHLIVPKGSIAPGDHSYYSVSFNDSSAWRTKPRGPWSQLSSDQPGGLVFNSYNPTVAAGYDVHPQNGFKFAIDVSFCSPGFDGRVKSVNVEARRDTASDEPTSISGGLQQLIPGPDATSRAERGVMTMNSTALFQQLSYERDLILRDRLVSPVFPTSSIFDWDVVSSKILPLDTRYWFDSEFLTGGEVPDYSSDDSQTVRSVSEDRVALFQEILQTTNSPALVMQSITHTILTDRYYKYQSYFTNRSTQTLTYSKDAIQPVRTRGYIIVVSAIAAHLVLVIYICIVLGVMKGTKEAINSIDQAWQAHVQIATIAANEALSGVCTTTSTDSQVEEALKRRGLKNKVFKLEHTPEGEIVFTAKG
ncbi:hypothetical protein H2200_001162 [Cladophialophora chaetospira]|uniref:Uncharacterized protein n=1 Tax=Cladophialophora chaetospira TaxID=386627 RepID=A0AA38XLB1_9EURO|nr:hypothetical protein H2200_001162 [Cladophialophora chaetospira]